MSYKVRFGGQALVQLNGIPKVAFDVLVERVVDLVDAPWDAYVLPPGKDPAFRYTLYGDGLGIIIFHVDEASELIRIFDLVWAG